MSTTITIPAKTIQIPSFVCDNKDDYFYSTTGQVYESDDFLFAKHSSISKFKEEATIRGFSKEDIEYFIEHYSDFEEQTNELVKTMTQQEFEAEWNKNKELLLINLDYFKELYAQKQKITTLEGWVKLQKMVSELQLDDLKIHKRLLELIDIRDNDPVLSQIYKKEE